MYSREIGFEIIKRLPTTEEARSSFEPKGIVDVAKGRKGDRAR